MLDSGKYDDQNQVSLVEHIYKIRRAGYFLACLFLLGLTSCRNDLQVVSDLFSGEEVKYDVANDVIMTYTEEGVKRLDIEAPVLRSWNQNPRKTEFPDGLHVSFYTGKRNTSNLTADYGINHEQKKELVVEGNVVLENDKGEKLVTEKLIWEEKLAQIKTESWVEITTPNEVITGFGLVADEDFANYKIEDISGIVNIEDE